MRKTATRFLDSLCGIGLLLGGLAFAGSLVPTLVPRDALVQGVMSGVCFALGYGIGVLLSLLLGRWRPVSLRPLLKAVYGFALVVCTIIMLYAVWQAPHWQNRLRALMQLPALDATWVWAVLAISVSVFTVLLLIWRSIRGLRLHLRGLFERRLSFLSAWLVSAGLMVFLGYLLGNRVLFHGLMQSLDTSYSRLDKLFEDTSVRPTAASKVGSAASLIHWDDLGRAGREFIAAAPDGAQIQRLTGRAAHEPIRVYVGLNSATDVQARAQLALRELIRVGGFQRSVLVIVTPTGTGWIDPESQPALEYLTHGDVATVTMQYSYLASWLSLLAEPEYGSDSARALFDAIYGYWRQLPKATRPKLYLHGLSLGALNSEKSHNVFQVINDPYQGAFWVGPPFSSQTWQKISAERNPDSPAWLPRFRDGSVIRFSAQTNTLQQGAAWGRFRLIYLQYASDAVTFYAPEAWRRAPDWLRGPRGPDVSPDMRWLPGITFLQLTTDLMLATTPPKGYGHVYAFPHYLDGWVALLDVPGWDAHQIAALKAAVAAEKTPEVSDLSP